MNNVDRYSGMVPCFTSGFGSKDFFVTLYLVGNLSPVRF